MNIVIIILSLLVVSFFILISRKKYFPLEPGIKAPEFNLQDENGARRSLQEFKGKNIVLYFYPKDNTPGCTKQACSFRDAYDQYKNNDIAIIGINYDSIERHKQFKEKNHLPFILLSDPKKEISKLYGAYQGLLETFFPKRISYLIDKNGFILKRIDHVDIENDAHKIITYFKA